MILLGSPKTLLSPLRVISFHAVDPGETTGYAWCLLGHKELMGDEPFHEMLPRLAQETSGYQLSDSRCRWMQLNCYPDENNGAENVWHQMIVSRHMTVRILERRPGGSPLDDWPEVVQFEDFKLRERTMNSSLLSPVRLTSKVEMLLHRDVTEFNTVWLDPQSASDAKSTATDERMRNWGLWQPGKPHATDALRHLLVSLRRTRTVLRS